MSGNVMRYARMPIEVESPEELGYETIRYNLSESSISDLALADLKLTLPNLKLLYGAHRGSERLRSLIVAEAPTLSAADVLITSGAAGALFIIATALLRREDHLVVVRPNYATNLETPRAIGCDVTHVDVTFEEGFRVDIAKLAAAITPRTRLISITCPHNPTGVLCTEAELRQIVDVAAGFVEPRGQADAVGKAQAEVLARRAVDSLRRLESTQRGKHAQRSGRNSMCDVGAQAEEQRTDQRVERGHARRRLASRAPPPRRITRPATAFGPGARLANARELFATAGADQSD